MENVRFKKIATGVDHLKPSYQYLEAAPQISPASTIPVQPNKVPKQKQYSRRAPKKIILVLVIILLFSSIGVGYYYLHKKTTKTTSILPDTIISAVDFPLYIPSKLPPGYHYNLGSANIRNGMLFYKLSSGAKTITITEQALPPVAINLSNIPSYSSLQVPNGKAALGVSVGNPAAIIMTGTTMVNINSNKDTPKDVVSNLAQSITLLPSSSSH